MSKSSNRPLLTDEEMEIAFREGATDEEIEVKLRDLMLWSYIMRDPFGRVLPSVRERGQSVSKMRSALPTSMRSITSPLLEDPAEEARALNGPWRLVLWPPGLTQILAFGQHRQACLKKVDPRVRVELVNSGVDAPTKPRMPNSPPLVPIRFWRRPRSGASVSA